MRWQRWCLICSLVGLVSGFGQRTPARAPLPTVEQGIEAATWAINSFEKEHAYYLFESALLSLSEANGTDSAAAPLDKNERARERQIRDAYDAWLLAFKTIDRMRPASYDPLAPENRCYLNLAPRGGWPGTDPKDVEDAEARREYQAEVDQNKVRCERNVLQVESRQVDVEAQTGLRKFLAGLGGLEGDSADSHFTDALERSALTGARRKQLRSIFEKRMDAAWHGEPLQAEPAIKKRGQRAALAPDEDVTPKAAKAHLAEWLRSGTARDAAWAAHYAARDKQIEAIPLLLDYVRKHEYDPAFEAGSAPEGRFWEEAREAMGAMWAALDALIVLRARVPAEDLLQIAPIAPDQALILAILPEPQEHVLLYFYSKNGVRTWPPDEYSRRAGNAPATAEEWMRWVAAGNVLVRQGAREFAGRLFDGITLKLHFSVVKGESGWTGNFACWVDQRAGGKHERDWPVVGDYSWLIPNTDERGHRRFLSPAPPIEAEVKAERPEQKGELLAPGGTSIQLVRTETRDYGHVIYAAPCPRIPADDVRAHWLERLGTGEYGKGQSFDDENPGFGGEKLSSAERQNAFQFYRIIAAGEPGGGIPERIEPAVPSEASYRAELKNWLATERGVYQRIVEGLREKGLITEGHAKRPLRMVVDGIDYRMRSAHSNVTFIKKAPWDDLAPPDTSISW